MPRLKCSVHRWRTSVLIMLAALRTAHVLIVANYLHVRITLRTQRVVTALPPGRAVREAKGATNCDELNVLLTHTVLVRRTPSPVLPSADSNVFRFAQRSSSAPGRFQILTSEMMLTLLLTSDFQPCNSLCVSESRGGCSRLIKILVNRQVRRLKEDVLTDLPAKLRVKIPIRLTSAQLTIQRQLQQQAESLTTATGGGGLVGQVCVSRALPPSPSHSSQREWDQDYCGEAS